VIMYGNLGFTTAHAPGGVRRCSECSWFAHTLRFLRAGGHHQPPARYVNQRFPNALEPMLIRAFIDGDETELRQVFMSSVHGLAGRFYTPGQLDAWAPRVHDEGRWADKMRALRPFVAVVDARVAGYADLQDSGCIDHFFVAARCAGRGVGSSLMAHIHRAAVERGLPELFAQVSLAAESFFARHGFTVIRRQMVAVNGVSLANAVMARRLPAGVSAGGHDVVP